MIVHKHNAIRLLTLILLLAVGPVQAQVFFGCVMMSGAPQPTCCCDDPGPDPGCADSHCDGDDPPAGGLCCERHVLFSLDDEARPSALQAKLQADIKPALDPPAAPPPEVEFQLGLVLAQPPWHPTADGQTAHPGSSTYLLTRRLRI